ncbi:hypothetical protein RCL1_001914 [Eukaryota sp. TZLM3-RCL]
MKVIRTLVVSLLRTLGLFCFRHAINHRGPDTSHSIAHLMDYGTYRHEDLICPNERSFSRWVPCGVDPSLPVDDLYKLKTTTVLKCSEKNYKPGHLHISNFADLQTIKEAHCEAEKNYCIASYITKQSGAIEVTVRKFNPETPQDYVEETLPALPPTALSFVFTPVKVEKENSVDHCGYNFMPYAIWDQIRSRWLAWAFDMEFTFSESSYVANKAKYPKLDYTHLEKSMKTLPEVSRHLTPVPWFDRIFE